MMITREVTVVVTNLNEAPVFSETTDTLMITENPDDPEKEPPSAAGYLYLLNRGVGKPAANLPAAPNLDVGIPVAAFDDDSTGTFAVGGYTDITTRDRIDGLTYTLSGTDAAHFHVVPATGQILTMEKLDYEAKNEYKVTVKATDPMGESDSINMTIEVTDVDEVPVPRVLVISGRCFAHLRRERHGRLGRIHSCGRRWRHGRRLEPRWHRRQQLHAHRHRRQQDAQVQERPRLRNPMGGANDDSNTYDVTLKVTDSSESDVYGTFAVSVTVTNVDELGALSGPTTLSVDEGATDVLGTYMITGGPATVRIAVIREGADADQFVVTVNAAGDGLELSFSSAPDYEAPTDADGDNTYEVTVKATAGGEETMVAVTVTVDNVNELGALGGSDTASIDEGDTDVGTYTLTGGTMDATATWAVSGDDAGALTITGGVLTFNDAPDFEAPADADGDNTYMVTVMASAGGEEETMAVSITVDNAEEGGIGNPEPDAAQRWHSQ